MSKIRSHPLTLFLLLLFFFTFTSADSSSTNQTTTTHQESTTTKTTNETSYSKTFTQVYAFGGSGTDTGNAQAMGSTVKESSSSSSSSSSTTTTTTTTESKNTTKYSEGRMSNGELVVDYLCQSLDIPTLPPYSAKNASASASGSSSSSSSNSSASSSSSKSEASATSASSSSSRKEGAPSPGGTSGSSSSNTKTDTTSSQIGSNGSGSGNGNGSVNGSISAAGSFKGKITGGAGGGARIGITGSFNFSFGINFAIAGSTFVSGKDNISQSGNPMWPGGIPPPFQTEILWFKEFLKSKGCDSAANGACKKEVENALFWLGAVGVSDYSRVKGQSVVSLKGISQICILHLSKLLQVVLDAGAKYVVVQGLPPVGCFPVAIAPCPHFLLDKWGCSMVVNTAIDLHNRLLVKTIEAFRIKYPQSMIVYANSYKAFQEIFGNNLKYKFQERTKACCGSGGGTLNFNIKALCGSPAATMCLDPHRYISWDGIHLTGAMNKQLSRLLLHEGFSDPPFSDLVKKRKNALKNSS